MSYQTLQSMLDLRLQELYAAQAHLAREIAHYIEGAVSSECKSQLMKHGQETQHHVEALSVLLKKRNLSAHEVKCRFMDALIRHGNDILEARGSDALIDLELVMTMRTIDTLEHRAYEDAKTIAEALGESEVQKVLEAHLREQTQQECSWTVLAEDMVDALAASATKVKRTATGGREEVQP